MIQSAPFRPPPRQHPYGWNCSPRPECLFVCVIIDSWCALDIYWIACLLNRATVHMCTLYTVYSSNICPILTGKLAKCSEFRGRHFRIHGEPHYIANRGIMNHIIIKAVTVQKILNRLTFQWKLNLNRLTEPLLLPSLLWLSFALSTQDVTLVIAITTTQGLLSKTHFIKVSTYLGWDCLLLGNQQLRGYLWFVLQGWWNINCNWLEDGQ